MFTFDLNSKEYKKIHFIGIGGVSMSGIAVLLKKSGFEITGSDRSHTPYTDNLIEENIEIMIGQKAENVRDQDLFIYTDAILPDNEEFIAAKATGKPLVSRGVFLGALMRNYKRSIAVSGSHGKSTTTSMLSKILVDTKSDASILLGGLLDDIGGNVLVGNSDILLTEACEFKGNILYYYPSSVIVLNIDVDHVDYYRDLDHIIETFIGYIENQTEESKTFINIDDKNTHPLLNHVKGDLVTFGKDPNATYVISNVQYNQLGYPKFTLTRGAWTMDFELSILGDYNIYNATAAIVTAIENGIDPEKVKDAIKNYLSLHRRMETVGYYNGARIITDYGHHPVEIKNTLSTLKKIEKDKLIVVFQPHTYSRTKMLLDEFAESFFDADEVVVTEIYAAREKFDPSIKSEDLVEKLVTNGVNAIYIADFESAKKYIQNRINSDDICITTGCGNPDLLAHMIVE